MPSRQVQRNDGHSPVRRGTPPTAFFTFPKGIAEEQPGMAKIQKWLDLADTVLAAPPPRKKS